MPGYVVPGAPADPRQVAVDAPRLPRAGLAPVRDGRRGRVAVPFSHLRLAGPKPLPEDVPDDPVTLGDHLKRRRYEIGLFQREVADRLGVSKETVQNWETGATEPAVRSVPRILEFLEIDTLPGTEPPVRFPDRLRFERRRRGLTQRKLAHRLGVDESTVRGWEKGEHRPSRKLQKGVEALFAESSGWTLGTLGAS